MPKLIYDMLNGNKYLIKCQCKKGEDTVIVDDGVKGIGMNAFYRSKVEKVILPDSVKYIETRAFAFCKNLKEIHFGNGLEAVKSDAFRGCEKLKKLVLPKTLKSFRDFSLLPSYIETDSPDVLKLMLNVTLLKYERLRDKMDMDAVQMVEVLKNVFQETEPFLTCKVKYQEKEFRMPCYLQGGFLLYLDKVFKYMSGKNNATFNAFPFVYHRAVVPTAVEMYMCEQDEGAKKYLLNHAQEILTSLLEFQDEEVMITYLKLNLIKNNKTLIEFKNQLLKNPGRMPMTTAVVLQILKDRNLKASTGNFAI